MKAGGGGGGKSPFSVPGSMSTPGGIPSLAPLGAAVGGRAGFTSQKGGDQLTVNTVPSIGGIYDKEAFPKVYHLDAPLGIPPPYAPIIFDTAAPGYFTSMTSAYGGGGGPSAPGSGVPQRASGYDDEIPGGPGSSAGPGLGGAAAGSVAAAIDAHMAATAPRGTATPSAAGYVGQSLNAPALPTNLQTTTSKWKRTGRGVGKWRRDTAATSYAAGAGVYKAIRPTRRPGANQTLAVEQGGTIVAKPRRTLRGPGGGGQSKNHSRYLGKAVVLPAQRP